MQDDKFSGCFSAGSGRNLFKERQAMKTPERTGNKGSLWVALLVFSLTVLISCGGGGGSGGGGSSSNQNQSSNWDTMVWDQDNWR